MTRLQPSLPLLLAAAGFLICQTGAASAPPILHAGDVPLGSLGHPVGSYLTIEGIRLEGFKTGVSTLRVDTVNGQKLKEPVAIWIDNLDLPRARRCKIKGYETLRMIGKPPAEVKAAEEAGGEAGLPQAGWQVQLYFVSLSVVEPGCLQIRRAAAPARKREVP